MAYWDLSHISLSLKEVPPMSGTYDFVAGHLNPDNAPAVPETLADYIYLVSLAQDVEGYHRPTAENVARFTAAAGTFFLSTVGTIRAVRKSDYPVAVGLGALSIATSPKILLFPVAVALQKQVNKRKESQTLNLVPSSPEARDVVLASIMATVRDHRRPMAPASYALSALTHRVSLDDALTQVSRMHAPTK